MTKEKKEKKKWINHKNELVPDKYVSAYDKKKEAIVLKLAKGAMDLHVRSKEFKEKAFEMLDELYKEMLVMHEMDESDTKGNRTIYTFDKSIKIEVNAQDVVFFSEKIDLAKAKLDEFLKEVTNESNDDVRTIVMNAFSRRKGGLDKAQVFNLFQLSIKHPLWKEAMDMIKESIDTNGTRRYFKVSLRDDNNKYEQINLNFPSL